MKNNISFFAILIAISFFSACKKEKTSNANGGKNATITAPTDTVTSFMVSFEDVQDSVIEVYNYEDPDGQGPKPPEIRNIALKANREYNATFRIEDGTGVPIVLNGKIQANGKDYRLCITNTVNITTNATDSDGTHPIGLAYHLGTKNEGVGDITFTIKYQKGVKNGDCSPGVVYHTCTIPISVF